jgi:hypothetical protein
MTHYDWGVVSCTACDFQFGYHYHELVCRRSLIIDCKIENIHPPVTMITNKQGYTDASKVSSYSSPHCRGAVITFANQSSPSPSHTHHSPFTTVEPGYGVDLFNDDYLCHFLAPDLSMGPALLHCPIFSVAFAYFGNIFAVHWVSVATSARLPKSQCVLRFFLRIRRNF